MLRILIFLMAIALLTGCATSDFGKAQTGGAVYNYTHTTSADGTETCSVNITSAREVLGGDIDIGEGCGMKSKADTAGGAADSIRVIGDLVNKLPSVIP